MLVAACAAGIVRADEWAWGHARFAGSDVLALCRTNALGAAVLSDADLVGRTVDEIAFTSAQPGKGALTVAGVVLSSRAIAFKSSVPLMADGSNSMFSLSGASGNWAFRGLEFLGAVGIAGGPEYGGAVACTGGRLAFTDCAFTGLAADQVGGAVAAVLMDGDVTVSNCTFSGNSCSPYNGYGGAIYASSAPGASARLVVADSAFEANEAENGGAICTQTRLYDEERPVALEIREGTSFERNAADFGGGAVICEGPLAVSGPNTVFHANAAGDDGGAICVEGGALESATTKVSVSGGVVFAENCVSSRVDWVSGGAISVMLPDGELEIVGAVFSNNCAFATSEGDSAQSAFGGAVAASEGCTNLFRKTAFVGNRAESAASAAGGAVSACGGETMVDNCVFDCRGTTAANCYGSAIDFDAVQGVVSNTTVRYGASEAISSLDSALAIVNCVAVGNALAQGEGGVDLLFEGETTADVSYTAYGSCAADDPSLLTEAYNLPNRVAEAVYNGDSLRLDVSEFNPVVELGLVQPDATDFVGKPYVSTGAGTIAFPRPRTSMGAFVEESDRILVLDVFGVKDYDSTTRSNGCVWTWKLTDTNGNAVAYDDLVPTNLDASAASAYLAERLAITNWVFGTEANGGAVGLYDSTNETDSAWYLDGGVKALTDRIDWLGVVLTLRTHGEIEKSWFVLPVDFGGGETNGVYFTWNWMKENLDRCPTNDFDESCGILREEEANGCARWQNYVMGVDGSDESNRVVTTWAPCGDPAKRASCVDVVTPFAEACNPPEKVGVEAEYRLYNVTHTRREILPETSGETWYCYATNTAPRFAEFDLSTVHYGLKDLNRDYGQCLLEIYAIFKKGEKPEGAK